MMTKITATFKGSDGSLGFFTGNRYFLNVDQDKWTGRIKLYPSHLGKGCTPTVEYSNIGTFFANWSEIVVHNEQGK